MSTPAAPPTTAARLHGVALALIAASVLARLAIAQRGYLAYDDFPLVSMAAMRGLDPDSLFGLFNNHLMPAGHLVTWLALRLGGFGYWPYLAVLVALQAIVSVAFYRLLRQILNPGWALLVPLTVFVFSPLTLEATSWWAVGINMLPMQLAMILAVGAFVKYQRTRRARHLVTLGLAVVFGLLFFEKAILAVALVFLFAVCLCTTGGPVRSVLTAIRQWWPAWAVLTGISLSFLALYLSRSSSSLREPSSTNEVVTFVGQMFGHTLVPGLAGGPWGWMAAGDGAPITAPVPWTRWVALAVVLGFIAYTIWLRRTAAVRAWLLVFLYAVIVAGLLGATRLGSIYSGVAGAVPRYIADVVVVAAIAIGAALCGLRQLDEQTRKEPSPPPKVLVGALVALLLSAGFTGVRFGDEWSVKQGRDYLATALADLDKAPAGTVFMDQPVPPGVVGALSGPYHLQSRFFAPVEGGPSFVTQASKLSILDEEGHIRPAWVAGVKAVPGPAEGCGYRVENEPVRIPLASSVPDYWHILRIAYLSDRDTTATLRIGGGEVVRFDVHRGLNEMFTLAWGGGDTVEVALQDAEAGICTDEIAVGSLVPAPAG